jgi:allophanate hydrolase
MGFRLDGPALDHAKGYNIVSDGIVAGSIQVPGSRRPIVLLADAQTTGGYPKIATVISADVPVIARRKPASTVHFEAVTQAEAEALRRAQEEMLRRAIADLQPVAEGPSLDLAALYAANLIDGAASAFD